MDKNFDFAAKIRDFRQGNQNSAAEWARRKAGLFIGKFGRI
jgi:hypothetical protein